MPPPFQDKYPRGLPSSPLPTLVWEAPTLWAASLTLSIVSFEDGVFAQVRRREVAVGFVVDAQSGKTLGFEVLFEGDGEAFKQWLATVRQGTGRGSVGF